MMRPSHAFFLAGVLILLQGCSWKSRSVGPAGSIVIVADPEDRAIVTTALSTSFGRTIQTPQDEPRFKIIDITINQIDAYARSPLILFFATQNSTSPTAQYVHEMLNNFESSNSIQVQPSSFKVRDPWSQIQLMMVITGLNKSDLERNANLWIEQMADTAESFEISRLKTSLSRRSQFKVRHSLPVANTKFWLQLPGEFHTDIDNDSLGFARYVCDEPKGWITIAWHLNNSSTERPIYDPLSWRRKIGAIYDKSLTSYLTTISADSVAFASYSAVCNRGLWQSTEYGDGGPFASYCFIDSSTNITFLVDYSLFVPGREKSPFMWRFEAAAQTFILKSSKE